MIIRRELRRIRDKREKQNGYEFGKRSIMWQVMNSNISKLLWSRIGIKAGDGKFLVLCISIWVLIKVQT